MTVILNMKKHSAYQDRSKNTEVYKWQEIRKYANLFIIVIIIIKNTKEIV